MEIQSLITRKVGFYVICMQLYSLQFSLSLSPSSSSSSVSGSTGPSFTKPTIPPLHDKQSQVYTHETHWYCPPFQECYTAQFEHVYHNAGDVSVSVRKLAGKHYIQSWVAIWGENRDSTSLWSLCLQQQLSSSLVSLQHVHVDQLAPRTQVFLSWECVVADFRELNVGQTKFSNFQTFYSDANKQSFRKLPFQNVLLSVYIYIATWWSSSTLVSWLYTFTTFIPALRGTGVLSSRGMRLAEALADSRCLPGSSAGQLGLALAVNGELRCEQFPNN